MTALKAQISIQEMSESHLESVMEIERASNPAPWSEASMRAELKNSQAHYFVALAGSDVRGFCGYWQVIDEAHITNVAVHSEGRRMGIGKALIAHALTHAVAKGIRCATLEVRKGNDAAVSLYEKFGFVQCAIRKGYYPRDESDAIVMWCYELGPRT